MLQTSYTLGDGTFFAKGTHLNSYVETYKGERYTLGFLATLLGQEENLRLPVQRRSGLRRGVEVLSYALPEPNEEFFLASYPGHLGGYTPASYLSRVLEEFVTIRPNEATRGQSKYLLPVQKFLEPFYLTSTVLLDNDAEDESEKYKDQLDLLLTALELIDRLNPHRPPVLRA